MTNRISTSYLEQAMALRQANAGDAHRPLYHFLPPSAWMNDPNGLIQWQGEYHLFYQYNPFRAGFGRMHWGHATSDDLVHWRDLPVALNPGVSSNEMDIEDRLPDFSIKPGKLEPDAVDSEGAWSGCAVGDDGVPTLVYTARPGQPEWVCLATSRDGLQTWKKEPCNPVVAAPPEGYQTTGFRDPYVWKEGNTWKMVVGSGTEKGGMVFLYHSPDLRKWEYLGPLLEGEASRHGKMWECPNFFPLGGKHVLFISNYAKVIYFVGQYDGERLHPESEGVVDWGPDFYAPQTFTDRSGRRLMFGWSWEGRKEDATLAAGWAGVQTLPRQLSLQPGGYLCSNPVPEVEGLRGMGFRFEADELPTGETVLPIQGNCVEIQAEFAPGAGACGLKLLSTPDGREQTVVGYRPPTRGSSCLYLDRSHASLLPSSKGGVFEAPLALSSGETLKLRIFIDRSMIEVYANERVCLTGRVYPSCSGSTGIVLFSESPARLVDFKAWEMRPIWPTK